MNVLIIGGTRFVGRHIAEALNERGHKVALFNRGSNPAVHPGLEQIRGDRTTDLAALDGRTWDAVIDTCGYTPDVVERSAQFFESRAGRYLFVSTVSVYDEQRAQSPDEDAPLHELPDGVDRTKFDVEHYGALKVLCENVARGTFGDRASIVRPGLVAGPHDPTDRFTYWPVRVDAGGSVLAPPSPSHHIQYIDARDLAQFCVRLLETNDGGTYNCVTPGGALTFGDLLAACECAASSGASFLWAGDAFLKEHEVAPWSDLPLWIPHDDPAYGMESTKSERALERGLRVRPLFETVRDTLEWARGAGKRFGSLGAGLTPEREAELTRAWRETA